METISFALFFKFLTGLTFAYAAYTHKEILSVRKEAKEHTTTVEKELKEVLKETTASLQALTILANKSPDERWINSTIKNEVESLKSDFKGDIEGLSSDLKGLNNSVVSLIATMQAKGNE